MTYPTPTLFADAPPARRRGRPARALRAWNDLLREARPPRRPAAGDAPLFELNPPPPTSQTVPDPCPVCGRGDADGANDAAAPADADEVRRQVGRWLATRRSPATARAYRRDLDAFLDFAGGDADALAATDRGRVRAWRDELQNRVRGEELSAATARRRLSALVSLFDHLAEQRLQPGGNPARKLWRPRDARRPRRAAVAFGDLPAARRRLLLAAVPEDAGVAALRDALLLRLCGPLALRPSEAVRLRPADVGDLADAAGVVDGPAAVLRVQRRRPPTLRRAEVPREARDLIGRYLAAAGYGWDRDGPLLRTLDGKRPLSATAARDALRRMYSAADCGGETVEPARRGDAPVNGPASG